MGWNKEQELLSEEEFENRLRNFHQINAEAVGKFASTGRAYRRGHITKSGMIVPSRVCHNRKNTCRRKGKSSRADNDLKREMWIDLKSAADEILRMNSQQKQGIDES